MTVKLRKRGSSSTKVFLCTLALILIFPLAAQAGTLTLNLDFEFSGAIPPAGSTPWITATFDDSFGGANTVRLTMSALNLVSQEYIGEWLFNFDPNLDPTKLTFAAVDNTDSVPVTPIPTAIDSYKADGDGFFDIQFDFPPPPGSFASKFTAGETVIYDITYIAPIAASSFDFASAPPPGGGPGPFLSAAHVQGIFDPAKPPGNTDGSGWIGPGNGGGQEVAEPAALLLLGGGFIGLAIYGRRKLAR